MGKSLFFYILGIFCLVSSASSWNTFEKLIHFVETPDTEALYPDPDQLFSEYIYGNCSSKKNYKKLYQHRRIQYYKLKGKVILRGWLWIKHLPSCIILRGTSFEEDNYRSTAFNFQICVVRLTFIHTQRPWRYFYYEWYIPNDISGRMNWDIYFYGPDAKDWGWT